MFEILTGCFSFMFWSSKAVAAKPYLRFEGIAQELLFFFYFLWEIRTRSTGCIHECLPFRNIL